MATVTQATWYVAVSRARHAIEVILDRVALGVVRRRETNSGTCQEDSHLAGLAHSKTRHLAVRHVADRGAPVFHGFVDRLWRCVDAGAG